MSDKAQPLAFQPSGPNYAPILMTPIDGMINEYLPGSQSLDGVHPVQIPTNAGSVRIENLVVGTILSDLRFRAGNGTVTAEAPVADVSNGSAGGYLPAGTADTYRLLDSTGLTQFTHLALKSTAGVRLTWFAK